MGIIFFLIGCSILVAVVFLGAFFWANKTGQHDDLYTPSVRILFEDEVQATEETAKDEEEVEGQARE